MSSNEVVAHVQVPGCSARGGLAEACGFAATSSGEYICAGNSQGDVRVYDTHAGKQVALVSPIKVCWQKLQPYCVYAFSVCH